MPQTPDEKKRAAIEAVKRHQMKTDSIMLRPYLEEGRAIRAAAERAGQPVSVYILDAVRERINREGNERKVIPLEEFTVIIHETPEDKKVNDEAEKEE